MSLNPAQPSQVLPAGQAHPTFGYVVPFIAFVGIMAVEHALELPLVWSYAVRLVVVSLLLAAISQPYLSFRPAAPLASVGIGVAVFLIWIGPDVLFGYRHFWWFENSLMGSAATSIPAALRTSVLFLVLRIVGSSILVPIVEELFWRGWLLRWLVDKNFLEVPFGQYVPSAFWIVALLFASEHGSYWEVGLAAGIIYNWWIIHTKNLADCMLAHAVTNAILAAYILMAGQWQYWL
ncbi:Abortive infection protein [Candidatus Sulfopaludibacter sp. SbA3]|nr:Abortive infection protein [Candidatus Sulfopaludibacter sp. SbA3]